ncbi:MAG: DUF2238 domain-containing protein [Chitinophagaceae bacterium]|nr:DUF2238 domain-containing protein [Chitinophagaceae bacterium]
MYKKISTATKNDRLPISGNAFLISLVISFVALWFYMYINCIDVTDWFIENMLVFIFSAWCIFSYKRFAFSDTSYFFFYLFLLLHIFRAMYAYTQNPVGEYFQEKYNLWRNPYDRVVHFGFGFLLAYPLHDYLLNRLKIKSHWQYVLPVEITLSLACTFELIEWTVAELTTKETGETYVATQGDVWDAHKDIALAVAGAAITMLTLYIYRNQKKK